MIDDKGQLFFWRIYIYKNLINWFGSSSFIIYFILKDMNNLLWESFYLSFYADELFANIIDVFFRQCCIVPAIFIFDRWLLLLMGTLAVKNISGWINKYIFVIRLSLFEVMFNSIQISIMLITFLYISINIFNYVL